MIPNMKNTKKHNIRTLPSIGSVSSSSVTRMRMPSTNTDRLIVNDSTDDLHQGKYGPDWESVKSACHRLDAMMKSGVSRRIAYNRTA